MGVEPIGSGNSHHFYKMEKNFCIFAKENNKWKKGLVKENI